MLEENNYKQAAVGRKILVAQKKLDKQIRLLETVTDVQNKPTDKSSSAPQYLKIVGNRVSMKHKSDAELALLVLQIKLKSLIGEAEMIAQKIKESVDSVG